MSTYKTVAIAAAREAGDHIHRHFKKLSHGDVHRKGAHDVVTREDMRANAIIIKHIQKHFPDHDILSEETGFEDKPGHYTWAVDPIDGTTNYVIGDPLFCTAIALAYKGKPLVSVTYAPALDEFYVAEAGKGATLNGKRIHVSCKAKLVDSISLLSKSHLRSSRQNELKIMRRLYDSDVLNVRRLGSTALDFAFVASGRVESVIVAPPGISRWDTLGGMLLVQEAGGRVTNFDGTKDNFSRHGVIASNGILHRRLVRIVAG